MGSKPSIIISGAAGFIGSHLIKRLHKSHSIYAFDQLEKPQSLERAKLSPVPIHKADLHGTFWPDDRSFDLAIHLAAETGVGPSDKHQALYWKQNVEGTERMAQACLKHGIKRLIYASSSSVYSPNQAIMSEASCTQNPASYYGKTKKEAEILMERLCKDSILSAIGLRFFTVYGSQVRSDMAAAKFIQKLKNGEHITLYNDGKVERDFTHVSDVCEAIARLLPFLQQMPESIHRIFNVGRGRPTPVLDYAQQIAKALDVPLKFTSQALPNNEMVRTHSDSNALFECIQFQPGINLETGISEMVNEQIP